MIRSAHAFWSRSATVFVAAWLCACGKLSSSASTTATAAPSATMDASPNPKTAEARTNVQQIAMNASSGYAREKISTATVLPPGGYAGVLRSFCLSATNTIPASKTAISGKSYQSQPADWNSGDGAVGWQCLKFDIQAPQYYMYSYSGTATSFTVTANGDLNGDGVYSTFSITGSVQSGVVNVGALTEVNPNE